MTSQARAALFLLVLTGCGGAPAAAQVASVNQCDGLGADVARAEPFAAPLTLVSAQPINRWTERPRHLVPEGVAMDFRAEPGMNAPYVHRVVACQMGGNELARIDVRAAGPVYRVRVTSRDVRTARELQERVASAR